MMWVAQRQNDPGLRESKQIQPESITTYYNGVVDNTCQGSPHRYRVLP